MDEDDEDDEAEGDPGSLEPPPPIRSLLSESDVFEDPFVLCLCCVLFCFVLFLLVVSPLFFSFSLL